RNGFPERSGPLAYLQRRERVNVHAGQRIPDGARKRDVGISGVVWVDAPLHAYLGSPTVPRLAGTSDHFLDGKVIRSAAQVLRGAAFRKRAELTAEPTDVRVINVAIDDVADFIPASHLPQFI